MAVVWQQLTTGKVHRTPNCSVARRTRYTPARREVTDRELASLPKCGRCWKGAR